MSEIISPIEFADFMQKLFENEDEVHHDREEAHVKADELMCKVLRSFGYNLGVEIFEKAGKWYA